MLPDMKKTLLLPVLFFLSFAGFSASAATEESKANVILITLDGLRFEEVWDGVRFPQKAGLPRGTELLPKLKARMKHGEALGFHLWISNEVAISQPGYRAILSGEFENRCTQNSCGNIDRRTIFDDLYDQGMNQPYELATVASWEVIAKTIESQPGRIVSNIAFQDYQENDLSPSEQALITGINSQEKTDLPSWGGSRFDRYTYALSRFYIEKHHPRLFYMQFEDTDELGHEKNYKGYVKAIQDFDDRLDSLIQYLDASGEWGENTSIVITTDHGRGRGSNWAHHSREFLSADRTWAFVLPSKHLLKTRKVSERPQLTRSQVDIRPTVELLLGVTPKSGKKNHGKPLVQF